MSTADNAPAAAETQREIFESSYPLRLLLHHVLRLLGTGRAQSGLDIGAENAMLSMHLRRHAERWQSIPLDPETRQALSELAGEDIHAPGLESLPFPDKTFDTVVVLDALDRVPSPEAFVAECHRVLKSDGRLIVNTRRRKPWSLLRPFQALCGQGEEHKGLARPGYSESELFLVLRDGFDVYNVHGYLRFFTALTDLLVQACAARAVPGDTDPQERRRRAYRIARPLYFLASQLDMLIFPARGYRMIALAKRRMWRPRKAPILSDGRTLTEALLTKAGG